MKLVPIIYVTDMDRSVDFYESLGATVGPSGRNPHWTEMELSGSALALHITADAGSGAQPRVAISLRAHESLENVESLLSARGIETVRGIADEAFGRSMVVSDPDGLAIQINEHQ